MTLIFEILKNTLEEIRKNPQSESACRDFFNTLFSQDPAELILGKEEDKREEDRKQIKTETSCIWKNYQKELTILNRYLVKHILLSIKNTSSDFNRKYVEVFKRDRIKKILKIATEESTECFRITTFLITIVTALRTDAFRVISWIDDIIEKSRLLPFFIHFMTGCAESLLSSACEERKNADNLVNLLDSVFDMIKLDRTFSNLFYFRILKRFVRIKQNISVPEISRELNIILRRFVNSRKNVELITLVDLVENNLPDNKNVLKKELYAVILPRINTENIPQNVLLNMYDAALSNINALLSSLDNRSFFGIPYSEKIDRLLTFSRIRKILEKVVYSSFAIDLAPEYDPKILTGIAAGQIPRELYEVYRVKRKIFHATGYKSLGTFLVGLIRTEKPDCFSVHISEAISIMGKFFIKHGFTEKEIDFISKLFVKTSESKIYLSDIEESEKEIVQLLIQSGVDFSAIDGILKKINIRKN